MTEEDKSDSVPEVPAQKNEDDPYRLKEYASDVIPADGGEAPIPKTAEPEIYYDNRIYVSNIPFSFTDDDLVDLFSRFGEVKSAMIVCNERGSKGFGFVTMNSVENCEKARNALHKARILGRVIEVRKATPLSKRGPGSVTSSNASSPRRTPGNRVAGGSDRRKKYSSHQIAINPNILPASLLPTNVANLNRPMMPMAPIINQQTNALNMLLRDNPVLLQNLVAPLTLQQSIRQPGQQVYTPTIFPTTIQPSFIPCTVPPLQQAQPGFAYRVATIVPDGSFVVGPGGCFIKQDPQAYYHGAPSLNATFNGTILSNSMNAHMQGMQENLVNLLNLDGTLNQTKLMDLKGNSKNSSISLNGTLNSSSSSATDLNNSGRKRRGDIYQDQISSPKKANR